VFRTSNYSKNRNILEQSSSLKATTERKALFFARPKGEAVKALIVGLIADTHDRLEMVDKAIKKLNEQEVELVLHAGDYIAPFVIPRFKELKAKLVGVFGNNDGDHELLKKKFSESGLEIHGGFAELNVDGLKIALLHGHEEELLNALINSEGFDVVVHGHTHKAEVYRKGKTLIVNPGEACGYLSGKPTIALLDTEEREARIIEL
jgi:putative phosphoesterase